MGNSQLRLCYIQDAGGSWTAAVDCVLFPDVFNGSGEEAKSLRTVSLIVFSASLYRKTERYFFHRYPIPNSES